MSCHERTRNLNPKSMSWPSDPRKEGLVYEAGCIELFLVNVSKVPFFDIGECIY